MKIVIQRVSKADVSVDGNLIGKISNGLLLLVGFHNDDTIADIDYAVKKILNMRIFEDENQKMNKSLIDNNYDILSISQFTLYANTRRGNRPSFSDAAKPEFAKNMYNLFNSAIETNYKKIQTGIFGADMKVNLLNDGPVTIILDTKNK